MTTCSQTNAPSISITTDPCKGNHTASSCIYHVPGIPALGISAETNLETIITTFAILFQQQAGLINDLTETVASLQEQINILNR